MTESGLKRGSIYAGFCIAKSTDALIVAKEDVFTMTHQYYSIEIVIGLYMGKVPDQEEYYKWYEPTDDTHVSVYALFGPRDRLRKEREEILIGWPTGEYATRITSLANGVSEILLVSHVDFDITI